MKSFYFVLVKFVILVISVNILCEARTSQSQNQRGGRGRQAANSRQMSNRQPGNGRQAQGGKAANQRQGRQANQPATANPSKDIATVVTGAKFLSQGKGNRALKAAYKNVQDFSKSINAICAKNANNQNNPFVKKIFTSICPATPSDICTTNDLKTVITGSANLAQGTANSALIAAKAKVLGCYAKIKKTPRAVPRQLQSFANGLKSVCAKRTTQALQVTFSEMCAKSKAPNTGNQGAARGSRQTQAQQQRPTRQRAPQPPQDDFSMGQNSQMDDASSSDDFAGGFDSSSGGFGSGGLDDSTSSNTGFSGGLDDSGFGAGGFDSSSGAAGGFGNGGFDDGTGDFGGGGYQSPGW